MPFLLSMLSTCGYEKACANMCDMPELTEESCAVRTSEVSKMCHAVQCAVQGETIARQDAKKHFSFFFHMIGHSSSSICISDLYHW